MRLFVKTQERNRVIKVISKTAPDSLCSIVCTILNECLDINFYIITRNFVWKDYPVSIICNFVYIIHIFNIL